MPGRQFGKKAGAAGAGPGPGHSGSQRRHFDNCAPDQPGPGQQVGRAAALRCPGPQCAVHGGPGQVGGPGPGPDPAPPGRRAGRQQAQRFVPPVWPAVILSLPDGGLYAGLAGTGYALWYSNRLVGAGQGAGLQVLPST